MQWRTHFLEEPFARSGEKRMQKNTFMFFEKVDEHLWAKNGWKGNCIVPNGILKGKQHLYINIGAKAFLGKQKSYNIEKLQLKHYTVGFDETYVPRTLQGRLSLGEQTQENKNPETQSWVAKHA